MTAALEVEGLEVVTREGRKLVADASLAVQTGGVLVILGESGSGKSLLAQAIMGNLPPDLASRGKVAIAGERVDGLDAKARRALWGRKIGLLPQEPWTALNPLMASESQVAEVHALVRLQPWGKAREAARAALRRLGLGGAERRLPFRLSGGMAQRVALAATEAGGTPILIADEPTKGLDADRRDEAARLLLAPTKAGAAVLVITHDVALARMLGGEVLVMREAEIVERGRTEDVLSRPQHSYTRRFVAADPAGWTPPGSARLADPVIEAVDLAKTLGGRTLFDSFDLALRPGEIVAATGPSGCGKTTLGNVLLSLLPPDAGVVKPMAGAARHRFQKIWQDPVSAFAPRAALGTALGDVAARHGLEAGLAGRLLARMRIAPDLLARRPDQVSGGELQRIALARALMVDPVFLFADEATSRLDPVTQQEVMVILRDVVAERGLAVLMVTHDRDLARGMAQKTINLGEPSEALRTPVASPPAETRRA